MATIATCPSCGAEVPQPANFCPACGTRLRSSSSTAGEGERKVVTVVFCDVVRATELGEQLGPETLQPTMDHFAETARRVLASHGGTAGKLHEGGSLEERITGLAVNLARRLQEGVEPGGVLMGAEARADLGEVPRSAGRHEEAARQFERTLQLYERKGNVMAARHVRSLLVSLRRN